MTEGEANIYGKSVKRDIEEVREEIGLCQQLDVLYEFVSIYEHLQMTLRIRTGVVDPVKQEA